MRNKISFSTALRATIIEGKGDCSEKRLQEYQHMMRSLWEELSDIADFDKVSIHNSFFYKYFLCSPLIFTSMQT